MLKFKSKIPSKDGFHRSMFDPALTISCVSRRVEGEYHISIVLKGACSPIEMVTSDIEQVNALFDDIEKAVESNGL